MLVSICVFAVVQFRNTQDESRLSVTQSILTHGDVTIERYGVPIDRAKHGRHLYSDKDPGVSLLALPSVAVVRGLQWVGGSTAPTWDVRPALLAIRVATIGPFLALLLLLLGRVSEGLAPGTGGPTAVAAGLGTMLGPLSTVLFAHVPATALGLAAFVVAARAGSWRGVAASGALAGAAALMVYEAALLVAALAVYVVLRHGAGRLWAYLAGGVPAAALLALYDAVAFGSPLRLSYHYKVGPNADEQASGFFGLHTPRLHSLGTTLAGSHGLVRLSPVLAAAALGLALVWRRGLRREVVLVVLVAAAFLALEAGYFDPTGGRSPGPRFFAPAVAFGLIGLGPALRASPRVVWLLLAVSLAATTWDAFTWFSVGDGTWPKLAFAPGAPRPVAIALELVLVAVAAAVSLRRDRPGPRRARPAP